MLASCISFLYPGAVYVIPLLRANTMDIVCHCYGPERKQGYSHPVIGDHMFKACR